MTIARIIPSLSHRPSGLLAALSLAITLQLTASACATAGQSYAPASGRAVTGSAALGIVEVTRGDLSAANTGSSLYSAIRYLRPRLLDFHGAGKGVPTPVTGAVYINGVRAGDIETLMSIPSNRVRKVEFLPADDRRPYGFRFEPGAILVTLIADRI